MAVAGGIMMLTKNFSKGEFECHCGCGLDKMDVNFVKRLQILRDHCNFPLIVNSGRRCKYWNTKSHGYPSSAHLEGLAVDIRVDREKARILMQHALEMGFKGIGLQQKGEGRFIHLDMKPRKNGMAIWTYS